MSSWASTIKDWLPIIGAVGGAFQGSKDQTVTNTTQLPSWLQALGPAYTNASIAASQQPFTAFGQYNPDQLAAFQAARNLSQGTPLQATGTDALTRAMQGGTNPYFGMDNPYTQKAIDKAAADTTRNFNNAVLPGLDSMSARANTGFGVSSAFDGSGGLRSEAYRNLGDTLANQANDMRYKDLFAQQQLGESNAARQIQAANLVPNYSAMNWSNIEPLLNIGNQQQNLSYNEFLRGQNWTDQMLKRLGSPFGFNQGTTSTSTAPGVGAVAGGISGLLGGYGMSQLGNNPFGRATQQTPTSDFQGFSWGYTPWGVF